MRKTGIILLFLLTALLFAACGSSGQAADKYEIVVVPAAWSEDVDRQIRQHVDGRDTINVYQNTSEEPDGLYQALLIEDLVAQEVDAICVEVVEEALAGPMIEKAQAAGIIVVEGDDFCAMIDQAETMLNETK